MSDEPTVTDEATDEPEADVEGHRKPFVYNTPTEESEEDTEGHLR